MRYSIVTVETVDGESKDYTTIQNFSVTAPFNNSYNFYDLSNVLHIWNWSIVKKITIKQGESGKPNVS